MTLVKDLQPLPTVAASNSIQESGTSKIRCPRRHSCDQDLIRDCGLTAGFDQDCPVHIAHAFADAGVPLDSLIGAIEGVVEHGDEVPSGKWRCFWCGRRQVSLPGAWCLPCKLTLRSEMPAIISSTLR
jgi:hypothetical protein